MDYQIYSVPGPEAMLSDHLGAPVPARVVPLLRGANCKSMFQLGGVFWLFCQELAILELWGFMSGAKKLLL